MQGNIRVKQISASLVAMKIAPTSRKRPQHSATLLIYLALV